MKLVVPCLSLCWLIGCVATDSRGLATSFQNRNKDGTTPIHHRQLPVIASTRGARSNARLQYEDDNSYKKKYTRSGIRSFFQSLTHVKASLLTLALAGVVVRDRFLCTEPTQRAPRPLLILLLAAYLIESYLCSTRRYLSNVRTPEEIKHFIQQLCEKEPILRWDLECYHYRDDWHHRVSSRHHYHNSYHRHSDRSDRVITHRASRRLIFSR